MGKRIRVLVVDDSSFMTSAISRILKADPDIDIVGIAHDGAEAVEKVEKLRPTVVTLDVLMPRVDGLTALGQIMSVCPTPVVMISGLTTEGAQATVRALELGAVDFFPKASHISPLSGAYGTTSLVGKVRIAARARILKARTPAPPPRAGYFKRAGSKRLAVGMNRVVVIASSTGGPRALMQIVPAIPADIPASILVAQHMPPMFTRSLAERLDHLSQLEVKEAEEGDAIAPGRLLLAPGDYHMTVDTRAKIGLNQQPSVWGIRPAADVTMESVAARYGPASLGVVLTGMGVDGTRGAALIKAAGGKVYTEHQSTCAVYGMPMSVIAAGYADKVLPVHRIAPEIVRACRQEKESPSPGNAETTL